MKPTPDKYAALKEPVYTPTTLSKALGISTKTVRRLYAAGKLRVIRPGERDVIILREDVVAWLDARASKPVTQEVVLRPLPDVKKPPPGLTPWQQRNWYRKNT